MIIAIPKENFNNETRVSCPPGSVKELIKNGYEVHFETGCGLASSISDDDYKSVGAKLMKNSSMKLRNWSWMEMTLKLSRVLFWA